MYKCSSEKQVQREKHCCSHTGYVYILPWIIEIKENFIRIFIYLEDLGQPSCYIDSLRAEQSGDQIPVMAKLYESFQTDYGAQLASYTMGNWPVPGLEGSGRGVDHPPTSGIEVKERLEQ